MLLTYECHCSREYFSLVEIGKEEYVHIFQKETQTALSLKNFSIFLNLQFATDIVYRTCKLNLVLFLKKRKKEKKNRGRNLFLQKRTSHKYSVNS